MVENVRRALGDERSKLIKNHARTAWRLDLSYRRLHRRTVYTLPREDGTANEEAEQDASPLEDAEDEQASESDKVPAHRSDAEATQYVDKPIVLVSQPSDDTETSLQFVRQPDFTSGFCGAGSNSRPEGGY